MHFDSTDADKSTGELARIGKRSVKSGVGYGFGGEQGEISIFGADEPRNPNSDKCGTRNERNDSAREQNGGDIGICG